MTLSVLSPPLRLLWVLLLLVCLGMELASGVSERRPSWLLCSLPPSPSGFPLRSFFGVVGNKYSRFLPSFLAPIPPPFPQGRLLQAPGSLPPGAAPRPLRAEGGSEGLINA